MNSELRRLIGKRLRKSREAFAGAEAALSAGLPITAVSRAYYAVFHAARARLATADIDPRKHAGVLAFFDKEFIKSEKLDTEMSETLHRLFRERLNVDYDDDAEVSQATAEDIVTRAADFVEAIEQSLIAEGLWETPNDD